MMNRNGLFMVPAIAGLMGLATTSAMAQQASGTTGTIDVTMTLTAACSINNSTATDEFDLGALDFGTTTTLFDQAEGQVGGNDGTISVVCSPGTSPTLTVTGGANDAASSGEGNHAMVSEGGDQYIPYSLYTDAARSQQVATDAAVSFDGEPDGENAQTLQFYGRAYGQPGLTAGTYTDTLQVSLTF